MLIQTKANDNQLEHGEEKKGEERRRDWAAEVELEEELTGNSRRSDDRQER